MPETSHPEQTMAMGARAARGAFVRFGGELTGKFASLALFIAMARFLGDYEVGIFVFGFAWVQIDTIVIELGYDSYLMKYLVGKRDEISTLVPSAIWLKIRRSIPISIVSLALLYALDYPPEEFWVVAVLTVGMMFDSISRTLFSVYNAFELGNLVGVTLVVQRLLAAVLGIGALVAGEGIVVVAGAYTLGAGVGLAVSLFMFSRRLEPLSSRADKAAITRLKRESRPFAANEITSILLDRLDAVILSLLATTVAVGLYGSAYRLLESTFFIAFGIVGAFAAMYVYLDADSKPTIATAYGRSLKLLVALLMPAAVAFGMLAGPIIHLAFGTDFDDAAVPLAIMAPATLLMGLAIVSCTLLVSRRDPKIVVYLVGVALLVNVGLCLALIPSLDEVGAAVAMLVSALVYAALTVGFSVRTIGQIQWLTIFGSTVCGGLAMAAVILLLPWPWSLPLGLLAYAAVVPLAERLISPGDFDFVVALLRGRGRSGETPPPSSPPPAPLFHEEVD